MTELKGEITAIVIGLVVVTAIMFVLSIITYYLSKLGQEDLSDQTGWRNYAKPFIAFSLVVLAISSIILTILILFSSIDL